MKRVMVFLLAIGAGSVSAGAQDQSRFGLTMGDSSTNDLLGVIFYF